MALPLIPIFPQDNNIHVHIRIDIPGPSAVRYLVRAYSRSDLHKSPGLNAVVVDAESQIQGPKSH